MYTAFAILTTWVLPVIALFSSLPFDSSPSKRKRRFVEAFTNWIGSPQAALTSTMFNIHIIRECNKRAAGSPLIYRDVYYVLSCINQYVYPSYVEKQVKRHRYLSETTTQLRALQRTRDEVLLYGLFRPLNQSIKGCPEEHDLLETKKLISNLACQLRVLRRHGVYAQIINILWFLVAFAISLVTAFADLGDNTTAHSL